MFTECVGGVSGVEEEDLKSTLSLDCGPPVECKSIIGDGPTHLRKVSKYGTGPKPQKYTLKSLVESASL